MKIQLKENSNTLLLKVYDSDDNNVRCNFAVVTITDEMLETISKFRKARESVGAYEVTAFDYSVNYLNQDDFADEDEETISEEFAEALEEIAEDGKGVWQIELDEIQPEIITDGDLIHVSDFGVKFTTYMKHTNIRFSTEKISFEILDKLSKKD